jgi:hypothetical protein
MRQTALKLKLVASKPLLVLLVLTPVLLFGVAGRYFLNNQAAAVTNSTINFQARLMTNTGSIAPDGDYNVEFKLYSALTSSGSSQGSCTGDAACLWTETRTSGNKIHVANGYISANLGSVTSFPTTINWDQQLYLTMNIGGTGSPSWDGEMSPRLKLTAVPYAFRASQLAALAGSHTGVLQFAASLAQDSIVTLPDPGAGTATVCYQASTACGFVTGASTNFIQNGTSVQAAANFNIRSAAAGSVVAVIQGTTGQTADLLDVQTWDGAINTTVFGVGANGQVTLGGGLSPDITTATAATSNGITLQPGVSSGASTTGASTTIKAGDVSGTTTVTGGTLTLQGGSATGGSGSRTGGSVTIDGGTGATANGAINIGTANAPTINIGAVGTTAKATTIHIADTTTTTAGAIQNVTIGSNSNLAHTTIIQGGNSNTAGSEAIRLVPQTAGGIAIGSTTGTGTITLGQANASNTINVGSADFTTASTQTINIANGLQTTSASTLNVNILSNTGNGNAGNAILRLGNNDRVQQIDIGNVTSDGNRTLNAFTGNTGAGVTDTINIGTGSAVGSKVIHIGDGATAGGTNTVTIGSTGSTSATTIQGGGGVNVGTGGVANTVQIGNITGGVAQTINIGTNATASSTNTVNLGTTSTSNSIINLNGGTGSNNQITLKTNNASTGVIVQSLTNSTSAFQVQNASGSNGILFNVDSVNGWVINNSVTHAGNLLENPSFEASGAFMLSGWNYSGQSAITNNSSNAHHGNNEMVSTPNGTAFNISSLKYLEASPGDVYYADIWYKTAASTNGTASFSFQYYNAAKTNIGSSTPSVFNAANTSYTKATLYDTAPASTAYVRLSIGVDVASTTGTWYFDDLSISRVNEIGPKLFKNAANSANAFQIQDASANNYLGVDTSGATITVGYASSTTTLAGTLKVSTLGASTSNSAPVCRDTSTNILTSCDTNTTGKPFLQGGNSFGVAGDLGTNDANALNIRTGGTTRLTVGATGGLSLAAGNALTVTSALTSLTGATSGDALTVSNSTSTGNIALFKDNSTAVVTIADGGSVLLQNATDSSTAFQVKTSAAGTNATVLGVDTSNARVGVGTAAPTRTLDVSVNNSTVNALPVIVQQAGTGDTGIELKNTSKNFYLGVDSTDGLFKIASAASANGTNNYGDSTGPPTDPNTDTNSNGTNAMQVTPATSGAVSAVSVYISSVAASPNNHIQAAIYANSTSCNVNGATVTTSPCAGTLLGTSSQVVAGVGWNTLSISGVNVTSGTPYWVALSEDGATTFAQLLGAGAGVVSYDTTSAFPAPSAFGQNYHDVNTRDAFYMTVINTGTADNFGGTPFFQLSDTGAFSLQNVVNSTGALRVQNAAGSTLFGVDTTDSILNMGAVGAAAVATTVNVATSTGATQTVNIGGTSGSAANGTTVVIQGGNTSSAISLQALASGTIGIGTNNAANTVQIGSTSLSSGTQVINIGTNNTSGGTTNITIGNGSSATAGTTTVQAKTSVTLTTNGTARAFLDNTNTMYLGGGAATAASPNDYTIQGVGASAATVTGAALKLQGGTGNTTGNGGKITLQGGTAGASGVKGLIELNGGTYFTTGSYSSGSTATITQGLIDSNSAILATATTTSLTFTVPSPTNGASQAGRVLYIVNAGSNAFTLSFASSNLSLSAGATATLIWSGTAWTGAGADSATLQNDYANSLGGTTPEIILDGTRKGIDIQDANGGYVGSNAQLLAVRTGASSGLGNPLLTVTNSGGNSGTPLVGIGVETATRPLHVYVSNSTTAGGPFLIEQAGSGDSSMEYKSTGGSFYTGIDTSDAGKFKINSSVAAGTSATFGRAVIGATTDTGDQNTENASKFIMGGAAGTMSSMSVYINSGSGSNSYSVALYADSGGVPGALIASSLPQAITPNAWNTAPITAGLSASTNYWLAFNTNDSSANMRYDNTPGVSCFTGRTFSLGWPGSFGTCTSGTGIQNFSIYATYSLNTTSDTFGSNSLFSLSNTGQATFQNFLNSSTAFQVLNAAGTTLLNVDTNTPTVNVGVTGSTSQAGTVNVGTSTGATQTINVGSATTGSASNGTTVLLQGGNTSSAVSIQALASGTIGIGTNNAANTLQVGSTSLSSGTQSINIGNNNTSGGTTNITIGTGSSATAGTTTLQSKTATNVTSSGAVTITASATSTWSTTAGNINIQSGAASGTLNLTGGTATGATAAGAVNIQGGAAAATAGSSGGGINILAGLGTATGTGGVGGTLYLSAGNAQGSGNNAGGNITLNLGGSTGTGAQGTFQVQNALGANLLTVDPTNTYSGLNLAVNSGAEVAGTFATNWSAHTGTGTPTITQDVTAGEFASGTAGVKIAATGANQGVRNNLGAALTVSTTYIVSFSAKSSTSMTDLTVSYYRNNTPTLDVACGNYSSQSIDATGWKKISCTFTTTGNAGAATAFLAITQVASATRSIFIDNLSIVAAATGGTSNVGDLKVGGALSQGLTLLTLDTYAGTPFTGSNASLAGSMYFDTTQGKIQCYDGSSWGACGAAPNNIITLSPEYAGAVLHQSGSSSIGTMTSDFCSGTSGVNINDGTSSQPSICSSTQTFNFYRWTSPQGSAQQYSLWVTYQLPSTFKNFVNGTTTLTGRTDSTNSTVQYTIYKNVSGSSLTTCSASATVSTGVQSNWQVVAPTTDPSGCTFAAGNSIIFKIDVISSNNANAYVSNLNFAFSNQ